MRNVVIATIGALALGISVADAAPALAERTVPSELSAQVRRPPARVRVYPGRLLYRDCTFRLAQQWRPSGTVIVPVQRCWWVRG